MSAAQVLGWLSTLALLVFGVIVGSHQVWVGALLAPAVAAGAIASRAIRVRPRWAGIVLLVSGLLVAVALRRRFLLLGLLQALAGVLALIESRGRPR